MKEIPILMAGPMAELSHTGAKTMTRRPVKHPEWYGCPTGDCPHQTQYECDQAMNDPSVLADCPYGQRGDRLWVRETWCQRHDADGPVYNAEGNLDPLCYWFRACTPDVINMDNLEASPWRPSIHMPRVACRTLLDVVSVRVERLQEMTEQDAIDEGAIELPNRPTYEAECEAARAAGRSKPPLGDSPRERFARLWDSLYGEGAWESNPWVWVVEFKRVLGEVA